MSPVRPGDLVARFWRFLERRGRRRRTVLRWSIEAAIDAVVVTDVDAVIVGWNAAAEKLFGWSREEALGQTLAQTIIPEDQHAEHLARMRRFREEGTGLMLGSRREVLGRRRDGTLLPVEITIMPDQTADGTLLVTVVRDISDRIETEISLRATEQRFRRLLETEGMVPWEADPTSHQITYVGPQAERLLGFPLGAWQEEGFWLGRVHEDDREYVLGQMAVAAEGGEPVELEYRMVHSDGQIVWVRDLVSGDDGGHGPVLRGFRFDVTERRRLEDDLLQASKLEAIGRLAGGIAHDFNNTLTSIVGYASLVEGSFPESAPERLDLGEIRRAATHAADLTQQLLAFARKQVIRPRVLVIDELVRRLEKMVGRLIGEDVAVVARPSAAGATVWVDPGRLEQALVNLVLNARDAMPKGGTVTLATALADLDAARAGSEAVDPGRFAVICVADTGVGMERAIQQRIFEPFFTTKKEGKGTGLGLSMAYGVVRQAGGFFEVESKVERGSTFRIYLPLSQQATRADELPRPSVAAPRGDETILLAEDEPQVRGLTERALLRAGYQVLIAQNGAEAVERSRLHEGPIHLLLTDVVMPVMGGMRAADTIRAERPGIRVLFVSGYAEEGLFGDGAQAGVHFLAKPFAPVELERKVREILDETEG